MHPTGSLGSYTSLGVDLGDLHRAAQDLLERALADVKDEADGVEIDRQVVQGAAAEVLVSAATPRDLLREARVDLTRQRLDLFGQGLVFVSQDGVAAFGVRARTRVVVTAVPSASKVRSRA